MNKIYVKTYFRIESGYIWGKGHTDEQNAKFEKEIKKFLLYNNFKVEKPKYDNRSITGNRGKENLYCHPQGLSGWIKKDKIQELHDSLALDKWKTFTLTGLDTYEE